MRPVILFIIVFVIIAYLYFGLINHVVVISAGIFATMIVGMNLLTRNSKKHRKDNLS